MLQRHTTRIRKHNKIRATLPLAFCQFDTLHNNTTLERIMQLEKLGLRGVADKGK